MKPFEVSVVAESSLAVVTLTGEVGLAVADLEHEFNKIIASRPTVIIFDMTGTTMISSLGLSLFVNLSQQLRRRGGRMFEFGAPRMVLDSFHRSHLDGLFEVRQSLDDALASAGLEKPSVLK